MNDDSLSACVAAYDAWAATYDAIDNPLIAAAEVILDGRAPWLAGARVLELGCGTGRNAAACLAAGAARYVGIDASRKMLAVARGRCAGEARVSFVEAELVAGVQAVLADGARFDVVLICLVLEHVPEVAPVMAAAATALARDGRLVVIELHAGLHALGVGANFRREDDREVRLPSFAHSADELVALATRAGLRRVQTIDHLPAPKALARSAKLGRYAGRPVLLELVAER
jgi:SAM-dependent methyltransferase